MAKTEVPTPSSKPMSKTQKLTETADAKASKDAYEKALAEGGGTNQTKTLSGLPITAKGKQYLVGEEYSLYTQLTEQQLINLKGNLAKVVGAYPRGREPKYLDSTFRDEDFAALGKVMGYAGRNGLSEEDNFPAYVKAILKLQNNPEASASFFNYRAPAAPNYSLTPLDMAAADFSAVNRSLLGSDPTPKEIAEYHSAINKVETKQKGQFSAPQRNEIAISFIQKKAAALIAKASNPEDKDALTKISTGNIGGYINAIRATYLENGISFTEDKVRKQAVAALRDEASYNNIIADIHSKAAVFVPAFKDSINAGKSARDVLSPYISMYSKLYGIDEDQVSLDDVSFAGAADKPMMPKDFNAAITNAPKFKTTDTYKNNVAKGIDALAAEIGIRV